MEQTKIYQELKALLSRHHNPSDDLIRKIYPYVHARSYEAKDLLIHHGEIANRICLVVEGGAVAYQIKKQERKLVALWQTGDLILHAQSALAIKKSEVDIVFLCNTNAIEISNKDLLHLRQQHPDISLCFDYFLADELQKMTDHICWLKSTKSSQRIREFNAKYKSLCNLLPDEQKAYFLNMSLRWYQEKKS